MSAISDFASQFIEFNPSVVASNLERFSLDEVLIFLDSIPDRPLSMLLPHLNQHITSVFLKVVSPKKAGSLLRAVPEADRVAILRFMDGSSADLILGELGAEQAKKIRKRMEYLPGTAGMYMDSSLLPVSLNETVEDYAEKIVNGSKSGPYTYVVDDNGALIGVVPVSLVFKFLKSKVTFSDIMSTAVDVIRVDAQIEEALDHPAWDRYPSLPVVDYKQKFLGVINYEAMKRMQQAKRGRLSREDSSVAGQALGELYTIGFSALVSSTASVVPQVEERP